MPPSKRTKTVIKDESGNKAIPEVATKKRGRPKGVKNGKGVPNNKSIKTKIIDGKLMKRKFGIPKRVMTGKPGRPRKEYVWVEVKESEASVE